MPQLKFKNGNDYVLSKAVRAKTDLYTNGGSWEQGAGKETLWKIERHSEKE